MSPLYRGSSSQRTPCCTAAFRGSLMSGFCASLIPHSSVMWPVNSFQCSHIPIPEMHLEEQETRNEDLGGWPKELWCILYESLLVTRKQIMTSNRSRSPPTFSFCIHKLYLFKTLKLSAVHRLCRASCGSALTTFLCGISPATTILSWK